MDVIDPILFLCGYWGLLWMLGLPSQVKKGKPCTYNHISGSPGRQWCSYLGMHMPLGQPHERPADDSFVFDEEKAKLYIKDAL